MTSGFLPPCSQGSPCDRRFSTEMRDRAPKAPERDHEQRGDPSPEPNAHRTNRWTVAEIQELAAVATGAADTDPVAAAASDVDPPDATVGLIVDEAAGACPELL